MAIIQGEIADPLVRWIILIIVLSIFLIVFKLVVVPMFQGRINWSTLWYRIGMLIKWFGSAGFKLYMLNFGMITIEFFLGLRAGAIYHEFFAPTLGTEMLFGVPYLLHLASVVAFLMVFVSGIYVATHQPGGDTTGKQVMSWSSYSLALLITLAHDWGGVLYNDIKLNWTPGPQLTITIIITICFCGLPVLPIIFGRWLPTLKKEHDAETEAWRKNWNDHIKNTIEDRMMHRVAQESASIPLEFLGEALPEELRDVGQSIITAYKKSRVVNAASNGGLPSPHRTTLLSPEEEYEESAQPPFVERKRLMNGLHLFQKKSS